MSNITSTLSIRVNDDGFADKLRADAEAARRLGVSAKDLGKLRANAGTAGLVKSFEQLSRTADKLGAFSDASRGLNTLGAGLRNARTEAARTAQVLAAAQRKVDFFDRSKANNSPNYAAFKASGMVGDARAGLSAAKRSHTAAKRTLANTETAFREQRTVVDSMGRALERAGHPVAHLARTQADLTRRMDETSAAIRRQAAAHAQAATAAGASRAEAERTANAQLRATVHGANAVRAERDARRAAAAVEARQANATAMRRAVEAGREARADREAAVAQEARRRATAGRDMAAGMGSAGRGQLRDIEGGRRVADGMSRPAHEARARAAAEAERKAAEAEEHRAGRQQARQTLGGIAGITIGHKVKEGTKEVLDTYREFDDLRRYQVAVADLTDKESDSRVHQARHLGATTRFNDLQALHAQLDLAQRGVKKEFVEPFIGEVVNYAQAMSTDLGSAAKTLEGIVFSTNQNVEDPATAVKVMRRQVDLAVKMSKIGGLDNDDVAQAFKFGGSSGSGSGLSNETMATTFALLRRAGYTGSEAGVAQRSIAGKLVSPTSKGLDALDAMGVKWEDHSTIKRGSQPELADNMMKRHFGKGLTGGQRDRMKEIFEDSDLMGEREKFVEAAVDAVQGSFLQKSGKNKGKLSAVDRKALAKQFGNLHKNLIESIDAEGLWSAIINAAPTLAQANAWGTDKHGGKIMALARKAKEFKEYQEQLRHTPEGFAKGIGDQRNAGYAGASKRLEGSQKNFESKIGTSLDNDGKGGFLTAITNASANAVQSLSELPDPIVAAGASIAWLGGKISSTFGTLALVGAGSGISTAIATGNGAGLAAAAGAGAAVAAPIVATAAVGAALIAADKDKAIVHGGKNATTSQDFGDELPGLSGEGMRTSTRTPSLPPGTAGMPRVPLPRLPGLDGRPKAPEVVARPPGFGPAFEAVPGAGKVEEATAALAKYREELSSIKAEIAASASLDLPGVGSGLEARKAQLEGLISGLQSKLDALNGVTIAPQAETGALDRLHQKADEVRAGLEQVGATKVEPQVGTGGLDALIAKAHEAVAALLKVQSIAAGANGSIAAVNAGGALRGRSRSFSDGVTPGAGAE